MPRSHADLWRDPALAHVESRRACHSRACYKAHSHPTFSIGAVDAGRSHFTGAADGQQHLAPGTLVLVPAHRVHACNPAPGLAWSYQMLHVDADWLTQLRLESGLGGIEAGEPVRICREAEVYRQFCALNRLLFSSACNGEKDAALIAFLGTWIFRAPTAGSGPRPASRHLERVACTHRTPGPCAIEPGGIGAGGRAWALSTDPRVSSGYRVYPACLPAQCPGQSRAATVE